MIEGPFPVVEWVDGVVRDCDDLAALSDDEVHRTTKALVDVLVALHAVDVDEVGLADYGRPGGFLDLQVALWRRQWEQVHTRDLPDLDRLHGRLAATVPVSPAATVVHGDFRNDNVILDRDDRAIVRAVVDWELSTLGDPLTDIALMCVYGDPAFDVIRGLPAAWSSDQLPSADALAADYTAASGRDLGDWPFYLRFAHLELAVIAEGIAHRALAGADAGRNAASAREAVPELVAAGLAAVGTR